MKKQKVIVAMSGGVDSSVAAAMLAKQGFEVIGIFLKLSSPATEDSETARKVAQKLNIPFYILDFRRDFKKEVVDYFLGEYRAGRTPNPCVKCNQMIKFGKLWQKTKELGADFLATGHYARIARELQTTHYKLLTAKDETKDQSYFLWNIKSEIFPHLLFPLGEFTKKEVRKMAKKWKLPTADRRESQEICFVLDGLLGFLKKYLKPKKGKIKDQKGKILGEHEGAYFYTIGQRHNLAIEPKNPQQEPYYVVKTDIKKNIVWVGFEKDLYSKKLTAENVNFLSSKLKTQMSNKKQETKNKIKIQARIRYGHPKEECIIELLNDNYVRVIFTKPQRAITPGQSVVFYDQEELLGGGIIKC